MTPIFCWIPANEDTGDSDWMGTMSVDGVISACLSRGKAGYSVQQAKGTFDPGDLVPIFTGSSKMWTEDQAYARLCTLIVVPCGHTYNNVITQTKRTAQCCRWINTYVPCWLDRPKWMFLLVASCHEKVLRECIRKIWLTPYCFFTISLTCGTK